MEKVRDVSLNFCGNIKWEINLNVFREKKGKDKNEDCTVIEY